VVVDYYSAILSGYPTPTRSSHDLHQWQFAIQSMRPPSFGGKELIINTQSRSRLINIRRCG